MSAAPGVSTLVRVLEDAGIALPEAAAAKLARHATELLRWNRAIRLTAITAPRDIAVKHVLDSLLLLRFAPYPGRTLDAGSGAGYPGIPLAVALPQSRFVLLDATAKKCAFLSHVCRELGLANAEVVRGRIAAGPALPIGQFEQVVSRATFPLPEALRLLTPYVVPGGRLILMAGPSAAESGAPPAPGRRMRFELPFGMGTREIREYRA
ncbi:MAG: 16S rRNA (guanine(527)-N(7))-methyltransferase RsmG [Gemmatimonadota bacterium]